MKEDMWGELRARLDAPKTRASFCKLLGWLSRHPSFCETPELQRYLRDHLITWPPHERALWEGEPMAALDRERQWANLIKPDIACPHPPTTFIEPSPAAFTTPLGQVTLTGIADGAVTHEQARHAGYHACTEKPWWIWQHERWTVRCSASLWDSTSPLRCGAGVVSYRALAHAPLEEHTVDVLWSPGGDGQLLANAPGMDFDAWSWFWCNYEHLYPRRSGSLEGEPENLLQFSLSAHEPSAADASEDPWRQGPGAITMDRFPHGLRLHLPAMKADQRVEVRVGFAWAYGVFNPLSWTSLQRLFQLHEVFDKPSTR